MYNIIFKFLFFTFLSFKIYSQETLNVGVSKLTKTMDPIDNWHYLDDEIIGATVQTLTKLDKNGNILGDLSYKWIISQDKKKYTFFISKGNLFSDKSPVTVSDILFSLRRQIDDKRSGLESKVLRELIVNKKSIYISKKNNLIIKIKHPYPPLIRILSQSMYGVIKKEKKLSIPPISSGPFLATYLKNKLILKRKKRKKGKVNKIIIQKISQQDMRQIISMI